MVGYRKGTTPQGEMQAIEDAFSLATAAITASSDAGEAADRSQELGDLMRRLASEAAGFRFYMIAEWNRRGMTHAELARLFGVSRQRIGQLVRAAEERGNPVSESTNLAIPKPVVLAIITRGPQVLIARRHDGKPPWTFPGGEVEPDEAVHAAVARIVRKETGLTVTETHHAGERVHELTSRHMVYVHTNVEDGEAVNGDPDDLAELAWTGIDETRTLMPTMYPPVRQYLDRLS
jgi:8-oxo-dGTP diphosphatase